MEKQLSTKAQSISDSVTLAITAKAKKMREEGIDVIGFGAGEPDFNTPEHIQEAGINAIKKGLTRYTPAAGVLELREAICKKLKDDNNLIYKPSQIIVSNGAKHSIYNTLQAICNPGDEVIVPMPYWVSYPELVKLADATPVLVETPESNGFKYNLEDLEKAITPKTKAMFLNSPSNPTGAVYTKEELIKIADIAIKHNVYVISDEIYEKLVYDDVKHISIASINEQIKELTIVINGMSKAYAMTGWRIGYTASNQKIATIMSNYQSHATSNPNSIAQYASIAALVGPQGPISAMVEEFEKRRNFMSDMINEIPGLSCIKPLGAFYVMANISSLKGRTINGVTIKDSVTLSEVLLQDAKVAVIPGSGFGDDNYIRLSYATSMANIEKGLNRIKDYLK